jgi:hypothetical protein
MKVTKHVISHLFLLAIGSVLVLGQQESPLTASSRTALVEELKGVVSRTEPDEKRSAQVAAKWDRRSDLEGKSKGEVIDLLYEDVKSVITNSGTLYEIYSLFSFYKGIPDKSTEGGPVAAEAKRLKTPTTIKGTIGGESHASYVVRMRKGQTLIVRISWKERNGSSEFFVSQSANFFDGEAISGIQYNNKKSWSGKIKKTGDYYVYVTGHPVVNYTLKVFAK